MNGPFYIGATGLEAQQRALEVVANNIANINTPGFKRSEVRFSELVGGQPGGSGADSIPGQPGPATFGGVSSAAVQRNLAQGDIKQSGNALDLAIDGEGFVELVGPAGQSVLWRGGTLAVNRDGLLTGAAGLALKDAITVPNGASALAIGRDGVVTATVAGETKPAEIGRIALVRPRDVSSLVPVEGGLFRVDGEDALVSAEAGEEGAGTFVQGALEQSNVQLTDEMVALMMMQRAYAANAQLVQAGDQLMAIANGLKR